MKKLILIFCFLLSAFALSAQPWSPSLINTGTFPNDGTGDNLRTAGGKINQNFVDVSNQLATAVDPYGAAQSVSNNLGALAFILNPTSALLAQNISDETGSGSLVFATSPTLTTPTESGVKNTDLHTGYVLTSDSAHHVIDEPNSATNMVDLLSPTNVVGVASNYVDVAFALLMSGGISDPTYSTHQATNSQVKTDVGGDLQWPGTATGPGSGITALNASQLASGTVPAARLPNPTASTLGGVESLASASHQFLTQISTAGVPSAAQAAFTDIFGTVDPTQLPVASGSTLGGIKIGSGLAIDGTGVVSTTGGSSSSQFISVIPTVSSVPVGVAGSISYMALGNSLNGGLSLVNVAGRMFVTPRQMTFTNMTVDINYHATGAATGAGTNIWVGVATNVIGTLPVMSSMQVHVIGDGSSYVFYYNGSLTVASNQWLILLTTNTIIANGPTMDISSINPWY